MDDQRLCLLPVGLPASVQVYFLSEEEHSYKIMCSCPSMHLSQHHNISLSNCANYSFFLANDLTTFFFHRFLSSFSLSYRHRFFFLSFVRFVSTSCIFYFPTFSMLPNHRKSTRLQATNFTLSKCSYTAVRFGGCGGFYVFSFSW